MPEISDFRFQISNFRFEIQIEVGSFKESSQVVLKEVVHQFMTQVKSQT